VSKGFYKTNMGGKKEKKEIKHCHHHLKTVEPLAEFLHPHSSTPPGDNPYGTDTIS